MKKYLIVIPARSGSKRIKDKNIIDICGKPLIAYTIEPSLRLKKEGIIDDVIFTTDSEKYGYIAQKYGAWVPFIRPKELSKDKSRSLDFMIHALNFLKKKGKIYDATILLQPTTPLRTYKDIKGAIKLFNQYNENGLITAYEQDNYIDANVYQIYKNFGIAVNPLHNKISKKEGSSKVYIRNGALYITNVNYLIKEGKIISDKPLIYIMPKERSIDLDEPKQLALIKKFIRKKKT